jgi:outer membrane protein assembly factor BamE (lipoprotein component of BamABCDE complex)
MADGGWFYVQSRWEHRGGRAPREIERQVLSVSFDAKGAVTNIERFGLEQGRVVQISRRITESNIKDLGLIRQLLGNFGNINPGQFLDRSRG